MAFDEQFRLVGPDIGSQTKQCLENLERVLLAQGRDRTAILKTTVWLTRGEDFAAFDAAYATFFGDHKPARSTTIAGLVAPGAVVEIEAIAGR
jgi:2-iminobutanoate/2-iminopropanoate deaminase